MKIQHLQVSKQTMMNKNKKVSFGTELLHRESIEKLGKSDDLVLLAHPDDETCFFGFVAKIKDKFGNNPQVVYTTLGQHGNDKRGIIKRDDYGRMAIQRKKELEEAYDELGIVKKPLTLDILDGTTHRRNEKSLSLRLLSEVIEKVNPKRIFTFDNTGITGHTDHFSVSDNVERILSCGKSKDIELWETGLTEEQAFGMQDTKLDMFRFARGSVRQPDQKIDIYPVKDRLFNAYKRYVSQFKPEEAEEMKKYLSKFPYTALKRVRY